MRRIFRTISIVMLCVAIASPFAEGQSRGRNGNNTQQNTTQQKAPTRPGNNNNSQRPANNGNNQRPGTPSSNQGQRPGTPNVRPGSNNSGQNKPGNRPNDNMMPGNNTKPNTMPGNNFGPGGPNHGNHYGPGPGHNHPAPHDPYAHPGRPNRPIGWGNVHFGAPYRPLLPPPRPYAMPVRPAYIPAGGPIINTILGVTFGTAINLTINALLNNGYTVTGYGDNAVYVSNAMQLNMLWPNATLYYRNGGLVGSEFVYSTPYYDMMRYDSAYMTLCNAYGAPLSSQALPGGGVQATWWGGRGQYVQLQFVPEYALNGSMRYYTTLSFGN